MFGEKDNGALVNVRRGTRITIELNENPTTGYRWMINSIDEAFLVPAGDDFVPPIKRVAAPAVCGGSFFARRAQVPLSSP